MSSLSRVGFLMSSPSRVGILKIWCGSSGDSNAWDISGFMGVRVRHHCLWVSECDTTVYGCQSATPLFMGVRVRHHCSVTY